MTKEEIIDSVPGINTNALRKGSENISITNLSEKLRVTLREEMLLFVEEQISTYNKLKKVGSPTPHNILDSIINATGSFVCDCIDMIDDVANQGGKGNGTDSGKKKDVLKAFLDCINMMYVQNEDIRRKIHLSD